MAGDDMDEVVTRGILKQELEQELEKRDYATKRDLEIWAGAIIAKVTAQSREETDQIRVQIREETDQIRVQIREETAQIREETAQIREETAHMREETAHMREEMVHVREDLQSALGVILGQLERTQRLALEPTISLPARVTALEGADLPGRVERLEAKVFRPGRTSRRGRS